MARTSPRWIAAGLLAAVALSACRAGTADGPSARASTPSAAPSSPVSDAPVDAAATVVPASPRAVDQAPVSPVESGPSGLDAARGGEVAGLPPVAVPLDELRSGGPPPDGIPPIDAPTFLAPTDVDFLADNEPVLAVEIGGEERAYPVQILIWHEIVNDTVGGVPVAVTYCPLCNSAVAYDRRVAGRVVTFGTSGLLWNSSLVMYDRQTDTLWSHFTGAGIVGLLAGTELETFSVATVPWRVWRDAHPDGLVLSRQTGHRRDYGSNPYPGYDDLTSRPFLFEGEVDGRYTAMTRVVGLHDGDAAVAVPLTVLRSQRVVAASFGDRPIVVWWAPGTTSALDAGSVAGGADVGATGVFSSVLDGRTLVFRPEGDGFVDRETGSTWNLLGVATAGPLAGRRLEPIVHVDTFWFAWATFRPATVVVR